MITLLALHYGASDGVMSLIFAAAYIGGFTSVFTPSLLGGKDTTSIFLTVWWIRAFVALGYLCLPWLPNNDLKILVLVATLYAFMALRAFGIAAWAPLLKGVTHSDEVPVISARLNLCFHTGSLLASVISYLVLRSTDHFPSVEWAYMSLLGAGFLFNLTTAFLMRKLPPTGRLDGGSFRSLWKSFLELRTAVQRREVVYVTMLQVPMAVAAGYQVAHLRNVKGLGDDRIFFLTLGGVVVAILGSHALSIVGRSISYRVLLFCTHACLFVSGLLFCWLDRVAPYDGVWVASVLFVINALMLAVSGAILGSLTTQRLPENHRVQGSIVFRFSTVFAGVLGIGGVALFAQIESLTGGVPGGHAYSHVYLLWCGCSIGLCCIPWRMRGRTEIGFLGDLAQLSPSNLTTVLKVHRLRQRGENDTDALRNMETIMSTPTPEGKTQLLEMLRSPEVRLRYHALKAVCLNPIARAVPAVMAELENPDSPLLCEAITALGFLEDETVIPMVDRHVDDPIERVSGCAIKSLARLGQPLASPELLRHYQRFNDRRAQLELFLACSVQEDTATLWSFLRHDMEQDADSSWVSVIFLAIAMAGLRRARLAELLTMESKREGSGIQECLLDLRDDNPSLSQEFHKAIGEGNLSGVVRLCHLHASITCRDRSTAIGLIYCTHLGGEACRPPQHLRRES